MLVWAADSHSIMNNNWKPLKTLSGSAISTLIYLSVHQYKCDSQIQCYVVIVWFIWIATGAYRCFIYI